jgi:creatinine amidohydrolase
MLAPRHRLLVLPGAPARDLALFAHEAAADALLLRALDALELDPAAWPGQDRDAPLYRFAGLATAASAATDRADPPRETRLDALTWPELETRLAAGARTAVVPLGSTEQHGPHLPLATDTWIADALAARFCARVPEALRLPALAVGCASEHLAFPGTLHVEEETLAAVLADLVRALDRHGFAHVFVFSAHGGNLETLRRAAPRLEAAASRARVTVFHDHRPLTRRLFEEAARRGVEAAAAGHHAGEIESSIVAALRPGALRARALGPGLAWPEPDTRGLFDPDLRRRAPDGTVGDPRAADPSRAEAYLDAWTGRLLEAYGEAKKRQATKGTVSP